jgi:CheY-like chemotaxis protein
VEVVDRCLHAAGIPPDLVELELTETASMDDPELTIPMLQRLKGLGVALSIDDFGTGYSNMQYLTRLPIDKLKLDGSFVRDITHQPGHLAIAESVIAMARRLELQVVAEMTETEGQVALLASLGCNQAQGHYFARALPAIGCAALLAQRALPLPAGVAREPGARRLLILDDDECIAGAVKDLLEGDGFSVVVAHRPTEAFELLARQDVGIVLTDQLMPEMSGVEFLGAVRRLYPATKRLIFTGKDDFRAAVAAINEGAVHKFLSKPLHYPDLRSIVAETFVR